jgi:hypothetical protein
LVKTLFYLIPVNNGEEGFYVVRAAVLVVEVVGVLPDVEAEDGGSLHVGNVHQGVVLVRGRGNGEVTVFSHNEPGPSGAEAAAGGGGELVFEAVEATEVLSDGMAEFAGCIGETATVGAHHFPEQAVVEEAATVIAHGGAVLGYLGEDVFQLLVGQVCTVNGGVELAGVASVMLTVVDFHGPCVNVRFQGAVFVGEFG